MHKVLVNRLGGLSLPRKSVVRLTDRPDMTLDVYRGRKTTTTKSPVLVYAAVRPSLLQCFSIFISRSSKMKVILTFVMKVRSFGGV